MIDVKKELDENNVILLVIPGKSYYPTLIDIVKQLNEEQGLYVTVNTPYSSLTKTFRKKGINCDKYFFIDAVSATSKSDTSAKNCIFVSSPGTLTELSIAIDELIKNQKPKFIIFDSLSALLIYSKVKSVMQFTQNLSAKIKENNINALFPITKDEALINTTSIFANKVIDLEGR